MLLTEWNWDDALDFRYAEGLQEGMQAGMEQGIEREREEITRNALAQGVPLETIRAITGLNEDTIKSIQAELFCR